MEPLIELVLVFLIITLPKISGGAFTLSPVTSVVAFIFTLPGLIFRTKYSDIIFSSAFSLSALIFPDLAIYLPMAAYSAAGHSFIPQVPLLIPLANELSRGNYVTPLLFLASFWMSHVRDCVDMLRKEVTRLKDSLRENEILNTRIKKEEEKNNGSKMEIALLNERNRISREIHDSIGHTITASLLQTEALKTIAGDNIQPILEKMSDNLTRGMNEIRATLHKLHSDSVDLERRIKNLTDEMGSKYKISITFQAGDELPAVYKLTAERFVREALTNIKKHSDADEVTIVIRELPSHYTFSVRDNGSQDHKENGKGMGLMGMEETAHEFKGIFNWGYSRGFFVHMTLPKEGINEKRNNSR